METEDEMKKAKKTNELKRALIAGTIILIIMAIGVFVVMQGARF